MSGRRPRALQPEEYQRQEASVKKPRVRKGEVRGHQAQLVPGENKRTLHDDPRKGYVSECDDENGEVGASSKAMEPRLRRIGDGASVSSKGMSLLEITRFSIE